MKGTLHNVWTDKDGVSLANASDDFYYVTFETREELEAFIVQLNAAADEKWPR